MAGGRVASGETREERSTEKTKKRKEDGDNGDGGGGDIKGRRSRLGKGGVIVRF